MSVRVSVRVAVAVTVTVTARVTVTVAVVRVTVTAPHHAPVIAHAPLDLIEIPRVGLIRHSPIRDVCHISVALRQLKACRWCRVWYMGWYMEWCLSGVQTKTPGGHKYA